MPVGCVPLAWKFRFNATLPPGAPDPEASASEGPCASAVFTAAAVAHSIKSLLKISRPVTCLDLVIKVANLAVLLSRYCELVRNEPIVGHGELTGVPDFLL